MKALAFGSLVLAVLLLVSGSLLVDEMSRRDPTDDDVEPSVHRSVRVIFGFGVLLLILALFFMAR